MRIVPVGVGLLLISLVGCTKPDASTTSVDAAVAANATPSAAASVVSPITNPASTGGKGTDSDPWPATKSPELKLTWAVYPQVGQGEQSTRKLELVARIGESCVGSHSGRSRAPSCPSTRVSAGTSRSPTRR